MRKFESYSRAITWFMALTLSALVAACGSSGGVDSTAAGAGAPAMTAKAITAYSFVGFPGAAGTIDEAAKTIALTVPNGTAVTALVATFTTTGTGVKVGTTAQTSGATANDFSSPVAYIVSAADGSTATYTATVTVASATAKAATAFSFAGLTGSAGTIDETAKTIAVTVPSGTNVTALVATFATTGSVVKVGTTVQTSGVTANDFTSPVAYAVTDANGNTATYTVTVSVAALSAKAMTAYSFAGFPGATGTIDETAKTIAVTVPNTTAVTALVATFTTTGTGVTVGTKAQTSAVTANDFSNPVAYTVTAADGTTAIYTVTVTVAAGSAKVISAYSFVGFPGNPGVIDETVTPKTIAVNLPKGTNVTALVATFTTTGTSVKVGATVQISTATANDFSTSPVAYVVTAADGSTVTYNVSVTLPLGPAPVLLGTAGNFVILAKTAVSTVPSSAITGDVGVSPAATSFLTGFSLTMVGTTSATSTQVTGNLYGADMTTPTNSNLTTAVSDMQTAYTDAAGRPTPDVLNLGSGEIGGQTLAPGLYTWTTGVTISTDVTLSGGPNDVWILQIPGNLTMSAAKHVILAGGAKAKNIFWQLTGAVDIGAGAHFEGIMLSQTAITLKTGASMNGRALAQTAVALDQNAVTQPAP
jgi:uncharacterized protein YcbX